jgi:hypothetical protein
MFVKIISVQGDMVLIENSLRDNLRIVTSILQKPLLGMPIEDINTVNAVDDTTATN